MARTRRSRTGTLLRAVRLLHYRRSFVRTTGLLRSFRERRPVDAAGDPLPWVSYPAIHLLNERLRPDHTVFEFGAGYSTLYFAARCAAVTTVEHDREWFDEVARVAPENVLLLHRNAGPEYWGAAAQGDVRYDLILVDGLERARCLVGAAQRYRRPASSCSTTRIAKPIGPLWKTTSKAASARSDWSARSRII